jgi:hypothetical protein
MSAPLSASPSNWKLPECRRISSGTRPADSARFAPFGLASMVIAFRYDQSFCHHALAMPGSTPSIAANRKNKTRFTIHSPNVRAPRSPQRPGTVKKIRQNPSRT